jgi:hypothetical protein
MRIKMTDADLHLLSRVVESSPVIVLVCLAFIGFLLRWHHRMDLRLREKDDQIIRLQRETLQAMHDVTTAVNRLTEALRQSR